GCPAGPGSPGKQGPHAGCRRRAGREGPERGPSVSTLGIVALTGGCVTALTRALKTASEQQCTLTVSLLSFKWSPPTAQQRAAAAAEQPALAGVPGRGAA